MTTIVLVVLYFASFPSLVASFWQSFPLSQLDLSSYEISVNTSLSATTTCVYDSLDFFWKSKSHPLEYQLALFEFGQKNYLSKRLIEEEIDGVTHPRVLYCETGEEECVVSLKEVVLIDKKIQIEFNRDTNQPRLETRSSLLV